MPSINCTEVHGAELALGGAVPPTSARESDMGCSTGFVSPAPIVAAARTRVARPRAQFRARADVPLVTRRAALLAAAGAAASAVLPTPARALDVVSYVDLPKGFKLMRPSGWNEFSATPEQYDVKWADVIQPLEFVTVLTTPAAKSLAALGSAQSVGEKLARSRGGELLDASAREIDGIPAYVVEIRKGAAHQITLLTVNKQKLYSLTASSGEKRWPKRERLLREVVDSFQPHL